MFIRIKQCITSIKEWSMLIGFIGYLLLILILMVRILEPITPLFSLIIILMVITFGLEKNAILTVSGTVYYFLSWPAVPIYGPNIATAIAGLGLIAMIYSACFKLPSQLVKTN